MAEHSTRPVTLAVAAADFGWGSAAKLSAILRALAARPERWRVIGLDTGLGRPLLADCGVTGWYDVNGVDPEEVAALVAAQGVDVGLCVLHAPLARALGEAGVPTVFVDGLPGLWTERDLGELPLRATAYCAQRSVELSEVSRRVLGRVANLEWVGAVVHRPARAPQRPRRRTALRKVVLNLGGLRTPSLADWACYPRVVVPAALAALADVGVGEVQVTGDLTEELLAELTPPVGRRMRIQLGPVGHLEFLDRLAGCDALVTAPGLTALLEASTLGTPTLCLPPQNVSQVLNARHHSRAMGVDTRVRWPLEVIDEDAVLVARYECGDAAPRLLRGAINRAYRTAQPTRALLRIDLVERLMRLDTAADWTGLAARVGPGGAVQVADRVAGLAASRPHAEPVAVG